MLSYFRVWGCPAYVKHLKIDKRGSKFDKYLFIGYPKKTKGYYFYLAAEQKMFVSRIVLSKRSSLVKELMPVKLNLIKFMKWKDRHTQN